MIADCVPDSVMRIKVASHLPTLNHSATDSGILKRQQAQDNCADWLGYDMRGERPQQGTRADPATVPDTKLTAAAGGLDW